MPESDEMTPVGFVVDFIEYGAISPETVTELDCPWLRNGLEVLNDMTLMFAVVVRGQVTFAEAEPPTITYT